MTIQIILLYFCVFLNHILTEIIHRIKLPMDGRDIFICGFKSGAANSIPYMQLGIIAIYPQTLGLGDLKRKTTNDSFIAYLNTNSLRKDQLKEVFTKFSLMEAYTKAPHLFYYLTGILPSYKLKGFKVPLARPTHLISNISLLFSDKNIIHTEEATKNLNIAGNKITFSISNGKISSATVNPYFDTDKSFKGLCYKVKDLFIKEGLVADLILFGDPLSEGLQGEGSDMLEAMDDLEKKAKEVNGGVLEEEGFVDSSEEGNSDGDSITVNLTVDEIDDGDDNDKGFLNRHKGLIIALALSIVVAVILIYWNSRHTPYFNAPYEYKI